MTIRKIISTLRTILKENTVDTVLSNRDIWNIAWSYALTLIQRELDTKRNIHNLNIFKSVKIKMKEVDITDGLLGSDYPVDCKMYRSYDKLPELVESKFGQIYKGIYTLDKSKAFDLVSSTSFRDKLKITKGKAKIVYIENGYLYSNVKFPLIVSGLFANIDNLLKKEGVCKVMDEEAPIPEYMISSLFQMTAAQLGMFKQAPQDTTINTNPNN
jgi:hypothetical protein